MGHKNNKNKNFRDKESELSIEEVLSVDFDRKGKTVVELGREEALSFLRGEALVLPETVEKGIVVVNYNGLSLGVVKNIGNRANNLYPKPWRIKKQI